MSMEHSRERERLKPCPFCGSADLSLKEYREYSEWGEPMPPSYIIECDGCGITVTDWNVKGEAAGLAEAWNDRA